MTRPKTILAFDTATPACTCALVRDGAPTAERYVDDARSVLVAADQLLAEAGIEPGEVDGLVVGTGPGSFTSIRIGLATARGIALATGAPVAGVSTLYAFGGGQPVLDARRGEVYTCGPTLAPPERLRVLGRRLVGDGALRYRAEFERAGAEVPPPEDPAHLPAARLLVAHAGRYESAEALLPVYLRAPDAKPRQAS